MALTSSSHASSYHVFLSFRGEDTRHGFTGNLYNALTNKGIHTFFDDEELQSGEEITPSLVKAIQQSRIAIIVLSINYAFSPFCLDELVTIIDCKSKGMLVIPVFYEVDPSDVRHHKGSYGEALTKHEERFKHKPEKLQKWKMALRQVANLSGYHFKKGDVYEYKFTESIVDRALVEINHLARLSVRGHLVGLEPQKAEIMKLLNVGFDDGIHIVGIHGMGGIGKSTLARVIYNDLLAKKKFDGSCYLDNVRKESNRHGLKYLQSILLQEILGDKNINLASVSKGASMIEDRLRLKKVLLVLDDVDKNEQLKAIVGSPDWFGLGSRIIIITRDERLLQSCEVKRRYEVKELDEKDALQLLTWNAFKKDKADPTYEKVLNRVVTYASGLPLALEVIGSNLFGKSIEEWESAMDQYKKVPHKRIQDILKISFDALQDEEKSVFLDIACYWKGLKLTLVEDILRAYWGHSMKYHIGVLVEKSLIKFDFWLDTVTITMHDLIEDMGKEIVWQESLKKPGKRSRLWSPQHKRKVLKDNTISDVSSCPYLENLSLKWCPNLVAVHESMSLELPHSRLMSLELGGSSKKFMNLTALNFDSWKHLTRIADLVSSCPNLEVLSFGWCPNLVAVHESKLENFPPIQLTSLADLDLNTPIIIKATGIHEIKHESNDEDIQFFNPYEERKPLVYDVFLNFKVSDTLHGFTGYLYKALHDSGIHTFIDDKELQRGEEITPEIVKAIEESRIAVTVFSINYASSSFCLDELASILDCLKRKRLFVLPVFYNVDPSDVQHQIGSYGEALAKHEERFKHKMDKLQKWKMALHQVANLPGFHFKHGDGYEHEFIGRIVERVSSEVNHTPLQVVGYPIGLEPQVLEVRKLLDVGCDDVLMIGICGIGGVGKSTLAREVYNLIADHFDASCFIENVREKSKKYGLPHLQSILLSKILGDDDITLSSVKQGIPMIRRRLQRKKVLLILDDVDMHEQLEAVVGRPYWFVSGSKVIITTQDEELLASHDVQRTYKVKELNKNDAFELLKWKAFKAQYFDPRYEELLNRAVTYASGLPLSLEIIGSNLFGKSVEEWKSAIHQLEKSPNDPIQSILKASFDALEEKARSVFLDICCCFNGYELVEIQDILHAHYGHSVKDYIDVLVDKSLVKLSHGTITLHDLIEEMGKEIEQQESLMSESAKRRRLWLPEDVIKVSGNNKGTSEIEIICLDFPTFDQEETIEWDEKAFQNMQNLKTIIIRNGNFSNGPEYLPNSLRVLEWWRYPSHHLPSDFHPKELTICKLPYSHISTIELTNLMKKFPNLRVLEFSSANI